MLNFYDVDILHYEVQYLQGEYKRKYDENVKEMKDHVQEARDHICYVKVKASKLDCMEEGFIQGFLKGVCLVHHKTGAEVEGLTSSQAFDDSSSYSDGDVIESELQNVFTLEDNDI
ncbi:hypothetical protein IEQ34_013368 [Dendrobium chrysotoxum]|uniref:Uncharacterized protein n=1 Tax=Dendrobium chrysotoxum TaxID=161865 RepID=A0AAV7GQV1_DENCH|nr:hypothetical protein IEQ34_013368 [Dendrobium chrysotoxum]